MPAEDFSEENILMELRPSRRRFLKEYGGAIVCVIGVIALFFTPLNIPFEVQYLNLKLFVGSFLLISSFLFIGYAEIRRYVEHYILTESAVFEEIGLLDKRSTNLPYIKLERCGIEEDLEERMMNIGDVRVDTGEDFFIIKGISNPEEVRDLIRREMRERMSGGSQVASVQD